MIIRLVNYSYSLMNQFWEAREKLEEELRAKLAELELSGTNLIPV